MNFRAKTNGRVRESDPFYQIMLINFSLTESPFFLDDSRSYHPKFEKKNLALAHFLDDF
jgi:hypothetical protein